MPRHRDEFRWISETTDDEPAVAAQQPPDGTGAMPEVVKARLVLFVLVILLLLGILLHPPKHLPDLGNGLGALATGLLGLSINPRAEKDRLFLVFYALPAALAITALVWLYLHDNAAAAGVLTAAIAAIGGLSLDTSSFTAPKGKS
ncbi:hypothetical protein ACIG5E_00735 [Kitasatospora sp. NPDC053057]|uniref:hypothetical protein n=1 Tax=Kitasatospora sp. NPDC053057 TaxID=3364062 RepID=UPI0037C6E421